MDISTFVSIEFVSSGLSRLKLYVKLTCDELTLECMCNLSLVSQCKEETSELQVQHMQAESPLVLAGLAGWHSTTAKGAPNLKSKVN